MYEHHIDTLVSSLVRIFGICKSWNSTITPWRDMLIYDRYIIKYHTCIRRSPGCIWIMPFEYPAPRRRMQSSWFVMLDGCELLMGVDDSEPAASYELHGKAGQ